MKIEKSIKKYQKGMYLYEDIISKTTYDDGTTSEKVVTIELGKAQNYSDFWTSPYSLGEKEVGTPKEKMAKCLKDVSRIAALYSPETSLGYKNDKIKSSGPSDNFYALDPEIALSDLEHGDKIDIYAGDILLNTALKKVSAKTKQDYDFHYHNLDNKSNVEKGKSLAFLASEINEANNKIKEVTPGFEEYTKICAHHKSNNKISNYLKSAIKEDKFGNLEKYLSIVKELNTYSSNKLDYHEHNEEINDYLEKFNKTSSPAERLELAQSLATKYLVNITEEESQLLSQLIDADDLNMETFENNQPSEKLKSGLNDFKKPEDIFTNKADSKHYTPEVNIQDAEASAISEKLYKYDSEEVYPLSDAISNSFNLLNYRLKTWNDYSKKRGEIDEGGLEKFAENRDDLFYVEEETPKLRIQLGLLIDESGSMCYSYNAQDIAYSKLSGGYVPLRRISVARKLATAFLNGTLDIPGVDLYIYSHAGPQPNCNVYRYKTPGQSFEKNSLVSSIDIKLHNYDGYAIQAVGTEMLNASEYYNRRILFAISDGEPSATNYSGTAAINHISFVCKTLKQEGLEVYTIGVDNAFPEDDGENMYGKGNFIIFNDFNLNKVANSLAAFIESICMEIR